jgi:hypothetical protein
MTEMNGPAIDPIDPATCHELAVGVSHGISTDGTQALFVFEDTDGKRVMFRIDVGKVKRIGSMIHDVVLALENRGADPGNVLLKSPTRPPLIGHSDQFRGHVVFGLEVGTEAETVFLFRDDLALQIAKNIEHEVVSRTSPQQRALMTSGMRRIILPPGH